MEKKQTNRVTMFKTVAGYLGENNSVWSAMGPFATAAGQLQGKIDAIDEAAQKQETPTTGAAADKAFARDSLEDALFLACEALGVMAATSNDNDLLALTAVSPSSLHRFTDEELTNRAATVLEKTNTQKTSLAALHVTQANIDELSQALQNFKAAKEKPRQTTAGRAAETSSLPSLIRDANDILRNQIDRLVNLFRRSNPKFVAGYKSARVIVDRAATHTSSKAPQTPPTPKPEDQPAPPKPNP